MYISLSNGAFMTENALKLVFSTVGKIDFTVKNSSSSKLKFFCTKRKLLECWLNFILNTFFWNVYFSLKWGFYDWKCVEVSFFNCRKNRFHCEKFKFFQIEIFLRQMKALGVLIKLDIKHFFLKCIFFSQMRLLWLKMWSKYLKFD